jgi:16S rRNA processing protein RimM
MAYKKHILLGKITKVHGHEGTVNIRLERNISDSIPEMESVFIETDGRPVPFFIDYAEQPDLSTLRIRFEGYDSAEKVREFVGSKIYTTESALQVKLVANPNDLINYKICTENNVILGVIKEIIENPAQLLLNIRSSAGGYFLLPLHEDLIREIDTENQIIYMVIPEGITDINQLPVTGIR